MIIKLSPGSNKKTINFNELNTIKEQNLLDINILTIEDIPPNKHAFLIESFINNVYELKELEEIHNNLTIQLFN